MPYFIFFVVLFLGIGSVQATTWEVHCPEGQVLSSEGINTMINAPICADYQMLMEYNNARCEKGNLRACRNLWYHEKDKEQSQIYKANYIELNRSHCNEKNVASACSEIWRLYSNDTYWPRIHISEKRKATRHEVSAEEAAIIVEYSEKACNKAKETDKLKGYYCSMSQHMQREYEIFKKNNLP